MQPSQIFASVTEWVITHTVTLGLSAVIIVMGWAFARFMSARIRTRMARKANADMTVAPAVAQIARYAIYSLTVMLVLGLFGVPITLMLTVLGAAGLAIALGLRGILSNVSSGLMILALRPMSVGDYVEGAGFAGSVVEIELFNTILKTSDGLYIFVPNSKIWGVVLTNYSREPTRRLNIEVGISYDADIALARRTMLNLVTDDPRILNDPLPVVHVTDMTPRAVMIRLRCWTATLDYWDTRYDLTESVKLAFDQAGVAIPHYEEFLGKDNSSQ